MAWLDQGLDKGFCFLWSFYFCLLLFAAKPPDILEHFIEINSSLPVLSCLRRMEESPSLDDQDEGMRVTKMEENVAELWQVLEQLFEHVEKKDNEFYRELLSCCNSGVNLINSGKFMKSKLNTPNLTIFTMVKVILFSLEFISKGAYYLLRMPDVKPHSIERTVFSLITQAFGLLHPHEIAEACEESDPPCNNLEIIGYYMRLAHTHGYRDHPHFKMILSRLDKIPKLLDYDRSDPPLCSILLIPPIFSPSDASEEHQSDRFGENNMQRREGDDSSPFSNADEVMSTSHGSHERMERFVHFPVEKATRLANSRQ